MTAMDQVLSSGSIPDDKKRKRKKETLKERKKHKSESHSHSHDLAPIAIEKKDKEQKKKKKEKKVKKDRKDKEGKKEKKNKKKTKTSGSGNEEAAIITDPPSQTQTETQLPTSSSSSSSSSEGSGPRKQSKKKLLNANRIHTRGHNAIEETEKHSTLRFYRREANNDFFISDSDSDSDDEGYTGALHPWHERFLADATKIAKEKNWPISTARFNEAERVRMDKRVKKLSRKRGLDLEGFRQQVAGVTPGKNIEFWQDIARVFPNRTLFQIVRHVQRAYAPRQAYGVDWTPEMDAELRKLVTMHGSKYTVIGKHLDVSTQACRDRYRHLKTLDDLKVATATTTNSTGTANTTASTTTNPTLNASTKWTETDTEKLLDSVRKRIAKSPKNISWQDISKDFGGKWPPGTLLQRFKIEAFRAGDRIIPTVKKMDLALQVKMLEKLRNAIHWKHESEIDFATLTDEQLPVSAKIMKQTYVSMRNTVPGYKTKKFHDTVETLYQRKHSMLKSYEEFGI